MRFRTYSFWLCLALAACDRRPAPGDEAPRSTQAAQASTPAPASSSAPSEKAAAASGSPASVPATPSASAVFEHQAAAPRLVAIGDLHGDLDTARAVFQLAGAVDSAGHWSGKELTVVQTGDQLDRGLQERELLDWLQGLQAEAQQAGGRLFLLNGNHETMNVMGDYRYVSLPGLEAFAGLSPRSKWAERLPAAARERGAAFLPGGAMALRLAERPVVLAVGPLLFAHGGVRLAHLDYGLARLNGETAAWMRGQGRPPVPVLDEEGPLWTRIYGEDEPTTEACKELEQVLARTKTERLFVGHTVQKHGISAACQGKLYRIDVGLSSYYGGHQISAVEVQGSAVRILSRER